LPDICVKGPGFSGGGGGGNYRNFRVGGEGGGANSGPRICNGHIWW
jgi:hypothetical protein